MKSAVITGATGMIGSSLIDYLIKEGVRVTAIVRPQSKRKAMIPNHPLVNVVECELDALVTCDIRTIGDTDVFFHLAWDGTLFFRQLCMQDSVLAIIHCRSLTE